MEIFENFHVFITNSDKDFIRGKSSFEELIGFNNECTFWVIFDQKCRKIHADFVSLEKTWKNPEKKL